MNLVLKLPDTKSETLKSFPFLCALNKYLEKTYPDGFGLHLVSTLKNINCLNLLPFSAYYHQIEQEDLSSFLTTPRAAKSLKIVNAIDIYITLDKSLPSAILGKNLASKERIGIKNGFNSWFLTKPLETDGHSNFEQELIELLTFVTESKGQVKKVSARELTPLHPELVGKNYIVLDLDIKDNIVNPAWSELFDFCEGKHFVLTFSGLSEIEDKRKIDKFINELPSKNTYQFLNYKDDIELARLLSFCESFTTTNLELVLLGLFCFSKVFYLSEDECKIDFFAGELKPFLINMSDSDILPAGFIDKVGGSL